MQFIFKLFFLLFLINCENRTLNEVRFDKGPVEVIRKYQIYSTKEILEKTKGYPPAVGSGLVFLERKGDDLFFYAISDRGPNAPIELNNMNKVIFFVPEYTPIVAKIKVSEQKAEIIDFFSPLKFNGREYTGMPVNGIEGKGFYETPVNDKLEDIKEYEKGIDSESIALDPEGNIWIGEEYEPSIIKLDKNTKKTLKIYKPGDGLPDYIKNKQINRGFESIAFTPDGNLCAILEGTLNFDNRTASKSLFIRFFKIDPKTDKIKVFAYKFDRDIYPSSKKVKIGDLVAVNNDEFLLVEQGETKSGSVHNIIYKINIKDATDISNHISSDGTHLEHLENLGGIKVIKKEKLLEVNKFGWAESKLEGLAIVDKNTIAISNDNDFGIEYVVQHKDCKDNSCNKTYVHKPENKQHTELWVIKLRNAIY